MLSDIAVDGVTIDFEEGGEGKPLLSRIRRLRVSLTNDGFTKCLRAFLAYKLDCLPVNVHIGDASFKENQAKISVLIKKGFQIPATITLFIDDSDGEHVLLGVLHIDSLMGAGHKLLSPLVEVLIGRALKYPGVAPIPGRRLAVSVSPDLMLRGCGVPVILAPGGRWAVNCVAGSLSLEYSS